MLAYDDSDGWYDHVAAAVKNASNSPAGAGGQHGNHRGWPPGRRLITARRPTRAEPAATAGSVLGEQRSAG
nr:hypothetical protein [Tersicoccus phoenicis]